MYTAIKNLHNYTGSALLIILFAASIYALFSWGQCSKFTSISKNFFLTALIASHLQLMFGFVIYFISPLGISNFSAYIIKSSIGRFYVLEHPLVMILGIALITVGYFKTKRAKSDREKFRLAGIFYTIALILILTRLPWHIWLQ